MESRKEVVVKVRKGSNRVRNGNGAEVVIEDGIALPITFNEFESIGIACDVVDNGVYVYRVYIGKRDEVEKWLNTFGGCDIIRFDRYDLCRKELGEDVEC